MIGASFTDF